MQRLLRQHQERAGHYEVVAVDEADEREHRDQHHVVAAERDAVDLAAQHVVSSRGPAMYLRELDSVGVVDGESTKSLDQRRDW